MKNRGFLLFTILISSVFCGKLTPEEDEQRAKTCGRVIIPPDHPNPEYVEKTPWLIQGVYSKNFWGTTGFLISPRHMIASCKVILDHHVEDKPGTLGTDVFNVWKFKKTGSYVDFKNCKNNLMVIPESEYKDFMAVQFRSFDFFKITSMIYMGNCEPGVTPSGMILLEFDVPEKDKGATPDVQVCLAGKETKIEEGVEVQEQSFGSLQRGKVIAEKDDQGQKYKVMKCPSHAHDFSFCVRTNCGGEAGGIVKQIKGATTLLSMNVLGVPRPGICEKGDVGTSIAFFREKICEFSGVCKETIDPNTSSRLFGLFDLLFFILISIIASAQ